MARTIAAIFGLLVLGVVAAETVKYVGVHIAPKLAPILGTVLVGAVVAVGLYFGWRVVAGPTERLAQRTRGELDYRVQRSRAEKEMRRRVAAIDEEQEVRALAASARVHESAERAVSEGKLRVELEKLKGESEDVVMRSQAAGTARMLARYQASFHRLHHAEHMTADEKARLLEQMRALLAEDAASPARSKGEELSLDDQPSVVFEYRSPDGSAVPVTAEGFRRLVERGQLTEDDECRRLGSLEWFRVGEVVG